MEKEFAVFSDGRSGKDFADGLEAKEGRLSGFALELLRECEVVGTDKVAYKLVLFVPNSLVISNGGVEFVARTNRKWTPPPRFIAPLLAEKLSDEWICQNGIVSLIVMHDPFADSSGGSWRLGISVHEEHRVHPFSARAGVDWKKNVGFVYLVSANSSYSDVEVKI